MSELSPAQAAAIASGVYLLIDRSVQSLQARRDALRQHVQIAHGLLVWAHAQQTQGTVSRAQAQQLALQALRPLRHDADEGFWVQDGQQRVLLHAGHPALAAARRGGVARRQACSSRGRRRS